MAAALGYGFQGPLIDRFPAKLLAKVGVKHPEKQRTEKPVPVFCMFLSFFVVDLIFHVPKLDRKARRFVGFPGYGAVFGLSMALGGCCLGAGLMATSQTQAVVLCDQTGIYLSTI